MSDVKISALTSYTSPQNTDVLPIVDTSSTTTKKITWANIVTALTTALASVVQTLTNKSIALGSNTLTGTTAQFNIALSDNDFATLAGSETLTNKTVSLASNTLTGTTAQFNTALSDNDFATLAGSETLTNKTLTSPSIATPSFTTQVNFGAKTAYFTETDNGNSGTSKTIDWGTSNKQKLTLTGSPTLTFTAPSGPCTLLLKLVQDGSGSRVVTWPAAVHWSGGSAPTLTTTASKVDVITFYYDGTTYFGNSSLNYTA